MHVSLGVEPRMSLQGDEGCEACITETADEGSEGGVSLQMLLVDDLIGEFDSAYLTRNLLMMIWTRTGVTSLLRQVENCWRPGVASLGRAAVVLQESVNL